MAWAIDKCSNGAYECDFEVDMEFYCFYLASCQGEDLVGESAWVCKIIALVFPWFVVSSFLLQKHHRALRSCGRPA